MDKLKNTIKSIAKAIERIKAWHLLIAALVLVPINWAYESYSVLVYRNEFRDSFNNEYVYEGRIFPNTCEFEYTQMGANANSREVSRCISVTVYDQLQMGGAKLKTTTYTFDENYFGSSTVRVSHTPGRAGADWYLG